MPGGKTSTPSWVRIGHQSWQPGGGLSRSTKLSVHSIHAGNPREVGHRAVEGGLHGERGEVPHLGQGPHVDEDSVAQDAHPVAESLDLRENVAGQEHRLATLFGFEDTVTEGPLHERVEPAWGAGPEEEGGAGT